MSSYDQEYFKSFNKSLGLLVSTAFGNSEFALYSLKINLRT